MQALADDWGLGILATQSAAQSAAQEMPRTRRTVAELCEAVGALEHRVQSLADDWGLGILAARAAGQPESPAVTELSDVRRTMGIELQGVLDRIRALEEGASAGGGTGGGGGGVMSGGGGGAAEEGSGAAAAAAAVTAAAQTAAPAVTPPAPVQVKIGASASASAAAAAEEAPGTPCADTPESARAVPDTVRAAAGGCSRNPLALPSAASSNTLPPLFRAYLLNTPVPFPPPPHCLSPRSSSPP